MKRGQVVYRCGAEATVLYPEDKPEVFERLRAGAAEQDCVYCQTGGVAPEGGYEVHTTVGGVDVWRFRDRSGQGLGRIN